MAGNLSRFERAAEVLQKAFDATGLPEEGPLLDEALRLHRLAIAEEKAPSVETGAPVARPAE